MKKFLSLCFGLAMIVSLPAQFNYTTVQAGNFTDPATWGGFEPWDSLWGYPLIINHTVVYDTSVSNCKLTVNAGGSLIEDATPRSFLSYVNEVINHGTIRISYLNAGNNYGMINDGIVDVDSLDSGYGIFANSGTVTVKKHMFDAYVFMNDPTGVMNITGGLRMLGTNNGTIHVDSVNSLFNALYNNGTIEVSEDYTNNTYVRNSTGADLSVGGNLLNQAGGNGGIYNESGGYFFVGGNTLNVDSIMNYGLFHTQGSVTNHGAILNFAGSNLTASADFLNQDGSMEAWVINDGDFKIGRNCTNKADFANNSYFNTDNNFTNNGTFNNASSGTFNVVNDFLAEDLAPPGGVFTEDGWGYVLGDFTNQSTINGSGRLCVWGVSTNNGSMTGTFDFCDNTGDSLDVNTGTFGPGITVCSFPCTIGVEDEIAASPLVIAPNPFHGTTVLFFGKNIPQYQLASGGLLITDMQGKTVTSLVVVSVFNDKVELECSQLPQGLYLVSFEAEGKIYRGKLVVE